MRTIVLNQNASISVFSLRLNPSFLQARKFQVIVYVMHNLEKNASSQNVTIFSCKRVNTYHLLICFGLVPSSLLKEYLNSWLKAIGPKYINLA